MSDISKAQVRSALRFLLIIQLVFTIVGAWLVGQASDAATAHANTVCFAFGGIVMLVNLAAHVFVWPRLLLKKSVALSIGVIVFKFALLGWIIYEAAQGTWIAQRLGLGADSFSLIGFAGGLALVLPSVFATALKVALAKPSEVSDINDANDPTNPKTA